MPRWSSLLPPRRALALLAPVVAGACAGHSDLRGGIDSLPRNHPAVVTIENARFDPPRTIALISADHPGVKSEDAALRRSGFKRAEPSAMDALLDRLESQGFLSYAIRVESLAPLDPASTLSRLSVTVDDRILAFVVPRHPSADVASRFNDCAHSVTELFNHVVDLHAGRPAEGDDYFLDLQRRLYESNRDKLGAAHRQGPPQ